MEDPGELCLERKIMICNQVHMVPVCWSGVEEKCLKEISSDQQFI